MARDPSRLADARTLTAAGEHQGAATDPSLPGGPALPPRYRFIEPIAAGGFGRVIRVWDTELERVLAMKLLHAELRSRPETVLRFVAEGRVAARLQHPGIVPVYDHGSLDDGTPWIAMREVQGETLRGLLSARAPPLSPRRGLALFASVCNTVGYAHAEGFVHRDLKPDNVMIGAFGEVFVMDWGLARPIGDDPDGPTDETFPSTGRGVETRADAILGTPAYMSPEQLSPGQRCSPASDVYALGALLFEILVGESPYRGTVGQIRAAQESGLPPDVGARASAAGRPAPPELCLLCRQALSLDPAARPGAVALARAVQDWLDGARRRSRARAIVAEASALLPRIAEHRARALARHEEAESTLDGLGPHAADDARAPAWAWQDEATHLQQQATVLEVEWIQRVRSALALAPEFAPAHRALADHYRAAHAAAEAEHRADEALRMESFLRQHDRGRHATYLRGDAALTLVTDPPGATVKVARLVEAKRRLVEAPCAVLGPTPIVEATLPHGSYLLTIEAEGYAPARYPVLLRRAERWDGVRPGDTEPRPVPLLRPEELGPDDRYVPAGWFQLGGDPLAPDALPPRRVWADGFVMRRFPVTNREYLAFLNALLARGERERAESLAPVEHGRLEGSRPVFGRDARGAFELRPDAHGRMPGLDWPVVLVGWVGAMAFAEHEAARTGRAWRLPHDAEWEKAARGVDGRRYPWGDHVEGNWANMVNSRPGQPGLLPVTSHPIDESPYGVRGLAGNVRDSCLNLYARRGPPAEDARLTVTSPAMHDPGYRVVRGGSWASTPRTCRLAARFADLPEDRLNVVGFRLCRSVGPA